MVRVTANTINRFIQCMDLSGMQKLCKTKPKICIIIMRQKCFVAFGRKSYVAALYIMCITLLVVSIHAGLPKKMHTEGNCFIVCMTSLLRIDEKKCMSLPKLRPFSSRQRETMETYTCAYLQQFFCV